MHELFDPRTKEELAEMGLTASVAGRMMTRRGKGKEHHAHADAVQCDGRGVSGRENAGGAGRHSAGRHGVVFSDGLRPGAASGIPAGVHGRQHNDAAVGRPDGDRLPGPDLYGHHCRPAGSGIHAAHHVCRDGRRASESRVLCADHGYGRFNVSGAWAPIVDGGERALGRRCACRVDGGQCRAVRAGLPQKGRGQLSGIFIVQ